MVSNTLSKQKDLGHIHNIIAVFRNLNLKNPLQSQDTSHRIIILSNTWSLAYCIGWGIQQTQILPQGANTRNYIISWHSLNSTQLASTYMYEVMPSHGTPYPGAPPIIPFWNRLRRLITSLHESHCLTS